MKRIAALLAGKVTVMVAAIVLLWLSWVGWLAYSAHLEHKVARDSFPAYAFVSVRPYTWKKGTPAVKGFVGDPNLGLWDSGEGTAVAIRVSQEDAHRFKPGCIVPSDYHTDNPDGTWSQTADLHALVLGVDQNVVTLLVATGPEETPQLASAFRKGHVGVHAGCG